MPSNTPSFFNETGTLQYNGYSFGSAVQITADSSQVRDEADRTTIYIRHEITVKATIAPVDGAGAQVSADDYMDNLRKRLTQDGQILYFQQKGFGAPLVVNQGVMRDVKWGPKTQMIHWEPIGSSQAVEIIWKVSVCLPQCSFGNELFTGIMAYNYEADYQIDQHGMTTRTIAGYLEIAQTRIGGSKVVSDSADMYWERVAPAPPTGYKRETSRHLSKDKSRLDFVITDIQIASNNAWPAYVTDISGNHATQWSRQGATTFRSVIAMEITVAAGSTGQYAWAIFGQICAKRLLHSISRGNVVLIDELYADEDLFGRTCRFRVGYRMLGTIKDFIGDTGMWTPLETNWGTWRHSLAGSMFSQRGVSHLTNVPSFDAIVDLCGPSQTAGGQPGDMPFTPLPGPSPTFKNQKPPPEKSWAKYKAKITPIKKTPTTRQKSLQDAPTNGEDWNPNQTGGFTFPGGGQSGPSESQSLGNAFTTSTDDKILTRGKSSLDVLFEGQAVRAGYPIPRPSIKSVGGVTAVEADAEFQMGLVGNYLGVPVYGAAWRILYRLAKLPGSINPPDDVKELIFNGQADAPNS